LPVQSRTKNSHRLEGAVAVVAGATRGAGRGIARALGEAGALVYRTGRSVRGDPSPYKRPETIEETAEMIAAAGGKAVPVRVDHTAESEVHSLFERVERDHGRLDVLVNSVAGEDPMMAVGLALEGGPDQRRGGTSSRAPLPPHHCEARSALDDQETARAHYGGDGK
jgi:NAD(P)-dependent dehydrogenase (short-subunit alcohol dehydrogenase family)